MAIASVFSIQVKELLSTIASLETTVSKLDEKNVALHLQLNKEITERRLTEYYVKHGHSNTLIVCSPDDKENLSTVDMGTMKQDKRLPAKENQHGEVTCIAKDMPIKGLLYLPNQLSEEMVHCMKNIFICLADSSKLPSKSYHSHMHSSPLSPNGPDRLSSSLWSLSDWPINSSMDQSSQFDVESVRNVLATENVCDPYKVRGKLSWADIGIYGLAAEISWMSVGKKQLEYAAGALRRYRSLVEQLAKVNLIDLSSNEKLAFWINIYNALIMHAYLAYGVPQNELKLFLLMQKAAYTIGGHFCSAAAIEYGILKMKPPVYKPQTALLLALHKLKVPEEQHKYSIDAAEPLVLFALSCGMVLYTQVRVYTAKNVKEELQDAQRDFIRASVGISGKGRLLLPKMLHCFARECVEDSSLAVWICSYLPPDQAAFVEYCMLQRKQQDLGSRSCGILPFDSRFRYMFLPDKISP
ncbi:ubiquinone biosynthesis protein (Protein of unknown function, DUF547) [Thalictrum thalictroides]|uniref:DUF547 domain-containing protein n=1 Tax=Thalictrum thalictroides TaxID=46969 RepID=A0A7J6VD86_THATH|nr:ubiquinone biosynthesis protein (Protein of unknown function, DUF547) [Thalictrum thalictroides]